MNGKFQLRLRVGVAAALVALGVWKWVPGSALDRAVFSTVARSSANGTLFVSGEGTTADGWKLRTLSPDARTDRRQAPVMVSLGDDVKNFFQSSPPAPIDLAVIFSNFHRLGARKAASAAVLAWEKPDAIGLVALERALEKFDSLVLAAPLSRGVVASAMPAAFRRTSIAAEKIRGDVSVLPLVNRLPLPGVILGGERTIAGFSVLESEPVSRFQPLMARWEDRVVFSFALLTVLQRLDLPLDGVEIRLGEFLKLGPAGPIVPVDEFGRFEMPQRSVAGYAEISAEALIDGGDDLFPKQAPDPVILRDDQSAAEPATVAFSKSLSAVIASMASNGGLSEAREYRRLPETREVVLIALVVLTLTALAGAGDFPRYLGASLLAGGCVGAQWIAFGAAGVWFPGLPLLAAVGTALGVAKLPVKAAPAPGLVEPPSPLPEARIEPDAEVVPEAAEAPVTPKPRARPAAKKTPAKKAATKTAPTKAAARKTAVGKTERKPRVKKPPAGEE